VAKFYSARSKTISPLPWLTFALPFSKVILTRHDAYNWGPAKYENTAPAQVEKVTWQLAPEAATRTVALLTSQGDVSPHGLFIGYSTLRAAPNINVIMSENALWTNYLGFKITKGLVDDVKVRQAINLAVNQEAMAENLFFGEVEPANPYVSYAAFDYSTKLALFEAHNIYGVGLYKSLQLAFIE